MEVYSGDERMAALGNEVSDAIRKALLAGLQPDFICSIVVGVAADYWVQNYTRPVTDLSAILAEKARRFADVQGSSEPKAPISPIRRLLARVREFLVQT